MMENGHLVLFVNLWVSWVVLLLQAISTMELLIHLQSAGGLDESWLV